MNTRKYQTQPIGGSLFLALAVVQTATLVFVAQVPFTDPVVIGLAAVYLLIAIELLFGTYLILSETEIRSVGFPLVDRHIPYSEMRSVSLQGMPLFANSVRMLVVETELKEQSPIFTDKRGVFRVGNDAQYSSATIAEIIGAIETHAPHVRIDPMARAFISLVKSKKFARSIPYQVLKKEAEREWER
jgi:hypothetical protein